MYNKIFMPTIIASFCCLFLFSACSEKPVPKEERKGFALTDSLMQVVKITDVMMAQQKDAITLRYLETMREISASGNSTTSFFPLPIDLFKNFIKQ